MKHSDEFFEARFLELQEYADSKGIDFPYRNLEEFKSDYMDVLGTGSKTVMRDMKYNLQYDTSYKTALAEKKALKEELGIDAKLKDLKTMTTREFAAEHQEDIEEAYKKLRKAGKSPIGARIAISRYWFGSM